MSNYTQKHHGKRQQLLKQRAQGMRAVPSPTEARLWEAIRARRLGVAFRRQVVLGRRYIADFAAAEVRLVVEVDGAQHERACAADARRDQVLERLGYRTLRVAAADVHADLKGVLERIRAVL